MRRILLVGLVLSAIVFLYAWRIGARTMWEPDETRYAEIGREMLESGDWIAPKLDFLKYYEKPPLTYWSTAVSFAVLGVSEASARLSAVLAALIFMAGTWVLGRKLYDARAASIGSLILALSPLAWVTGRLLLTDIFLGVGVVWALAGYALALERKDQGRNSAGGMIIAGLGLAVAMLAKGPIGVLIPLLGIVPHRALAGRAVAIGARGWALAGGILLLLAAPWFVALSVRDPSFAEFFFIHEHVLRFFTPEAHRAQPAYFYPLVLLAGFFPVSLLMPWAAATTWPGLRPVTREDRGTLLLGALGLLTVLLFTASHSKLATYILPAAPAFALVAGHALSRVLFDRTPAHDAPRRATPGSQWADAAPMSAGKGGSDLLTDRAQQSAAAPQAGALEERPGGRSLSKGLRLSMGLAAAASAFGAIATAWAVLYPILALPPGDDLLLAPALFLLLTAALGAPVLFASTRTLGRGLLAAAAVLFLMLMGVEVLLERLDPERAIKPAAEFVRARADAADLVASYGSVLHGLTFYTQRRTAIIGGAGELTFGARRGGHGGWVIPQENLPALLAQRRVFIVLPRNMAARANEDSGGKLELLLDGPSYRVFSNR